MANLYLDKAVANTRERKQTAAHLVAKYYPLLQASGRRRYGSLININFSVLTDRPTGIQWKNEERGDFKMEKQPFFISLKCILIWENEDGRKK